MAAKPRPRLTLLALSIVVPALLAGSLTAVLVLPERGASSPGPEAKPPTQLPDVDLERPKPRRRPAPPLGISIPAVGVQGPVDPVRAVAGQLEIPPPGRAGWFRGGPRPGEPGRAVIVSHVDSREGPALFASLRSLPTGTRILVEDLRGGIHGFRLTRRLQIQKSQFRPELVSAPSAQSKLVLITCGGPFTPGEGYRDNIILYARKA